MGLNIGGICISRNLVKHEAALGKILEAQLEFACNINMEEVTSDWPNEQFIDVYFSEKGTIIFCDLDFCTLPYLIDGESALSFVHVETSMSFSINYSENAVLLRALTEHEESILESVGEKLPIEQEEKDTSEFIFKLFEQVAGVSFWDIEPDAQLKRYKFKIEPQYQELVQKEAAVVETEITPESIEVEENYDKMQLSRTATQEQLTRDYSEDELIDFWYRLVAHCQRNLWNVFLSPKGFSGERGTVLSNLELARSVIQDRPEIRQKLNAAMNLDEFNWICRHWSSAIDDQTRNNTMRKTMLIKTPYYVVPQSAIPGGRKWWKFW